MAQMALPLVKQFGVLKKPWDKKRQEKSCQDGKRP